MHAVEDEQHSCLIALIASPFYHAQVSIHLYPWQYAD